MVLRCLTAVALFALFFLLAACGGADSEGGFDPVTVGSITITDAVIKQPGENVFPDMKITNNGSQPDKLTAITAPGVNGTNFVHRYKNAQGIWQILDVDSVPIAAGETLNTKLNTYSIHLLTVKPTPAVGTTYPVTLTFENAGQVTINIPVVATRLK